MKSKTVMTRATREKLQPIIVMYDSISMSFFERTASPPDEAETCREIHIHAILSHY